MNYKLFLFILPLAAILQSCTSEESQIKDVALEAAQQQYKAEISAAASERIQGKDIVKDLMVSKIVGRTEFEIDKVDVSGTSAKALIKMKTIPLKVREALTDILVKLDSGRQNNFNVPDAIGMVYQQLGLKPETMTDETRVINLRKDTVWRAQNPPANL